MSHKYNTRSKQNGDPPSDVDDQGNLKGLIDYECTEAFDKQELKQLLKSLYPKRKQSKIQVEEIDVSTKRNKKSKSKRVSMNVQSMDDQSMDDQSMDDQSMDDRSNLPMTNLPLSNQSIKRKPCKKADDLGNLLMNYILKKANDNLKQKRKHRSPKKKILKAKPKKKNIVLDIVFDTTPENKSEPSTPLSETITSDEDFKVSSEQLNQSESSISSDSEDMDDELFMDTIDYEEMTDKTTTTEDSDYELSDTDINEDSEEYMTEEDEEEEEEDLYDSDDEEYSDLVEKYMNDNTEDGNLHYFHNLEPEKKKSYIEQIKHIYSISGSNVPLKFKVLNSDMDIYTKSIAISNLDKLSEMDISTGEYNKMDQWINGLIKLPFGKVTELPVTNEDSFDAKRDYIQATMNNMNKAIYGHTEAKTHILQVIGKWIRNPKSLGNVLAIQGPMGNGKTTLIKNGIAKSLNRPFEFVALGGASDSAFFEGHSYTYEGSRWGRIVDILHKCGSMNPIICFDELDKVSETAKGDEIINMLIHMTDSSQNSKFQDNYFPGIDIDLSKVLFIFSFNDETKINRILKDRMYVIRTKGYEVKDKLQIAHNYLLPEIYQLFNYTKEDICFTDEILKEIIKTYTCGEEGVRNLKRCLENIVSTLNIYHLTKSNDKEDIIDMKIKDFKLPITLNLDHIKDLLKITYGDKPPEHMYL